jgi:hypothetical protein
MSASVVSARVQLLLDVLGALFEHDRKLVGELYAAQQRLLDASERVAGEVGETIRSAFGEYRSVAEQRRLLGADVGEAVERLVDAMQAAAVSGAQAREADVSALREGVDRPGPAGGGERR